MKDALLLVFANKQDLPSGASSAYIALISVWVTLTIAIAMRPKEVSDKLQLEKIAKDHVWKVEPSCATTGEGIFEGLVSSPAAQRLIIVLIFLTGMALQQRQATSQINAAPQHLSKRLHARQPSSSSHFFCIYPVSSVLGPSFRLILF